MPRTEQYGFRADDELAAKIERFKTLHGYEHDAKAVSELVEIGYREAKMPIVYRIFDRANDAAFYLTITAIITVVAAYTTPVMHATVGMHIAVIMIAIGMGLVGFVEFVRLVTDQNELGERVRRLRGVGK